MAFLSSFSAIGIIQNRDSFSSDFTLIEINKLIYKYFKALSALTTLDESYKSMPCSAIAAAIVLYVRMIVRVSPLWPIDMIKLTSYEGVALCDIVNRLRLSLKAMESPPTSTSTPAPTKILQCLNTTEFEAMLSCNEAALSWTELIASEYNSTDDETSAGDEEYRNCHHNVVPATPEPDKENRMTASPLAVSGLHSPV